jgi:hypothetical protein
MPRPNSAARIWSSACRIAGERLPKERSRLRPYCCFFWYGCTNGWSSEIGGMYWPIRSRVHQTFGQSLQSATGMPSSGTYRNRFGSLRRAYLLAGYTLSRDYRYLEIIRNLQSLRPKIVDELTLQLNQRGASVTRDAQTDFLLINGEFTANVVLSRCRQTASGSLCWSFRIEKRFAADVTILVRMNAANERPVDYYLLPILDLVRFGGVLRESNGAHFEAYQFRQFGIPGRDGEQA